MPRKRKGEQKQGVCVNCGFAGPIESEHIFPKLIFPELDKQMATVPACRACNDKKRLADEDLRLAIVIDSATSHHPDYEVLMARALVGASNSVRRDIWERTQAGSQVNVVDDDGNVLTHQWAIDFDDSRILWSHALVTRGLYFLEFNSLLPLEVPVFVERLPWNVAVDFVKRISAYRVGAIKYKGNTVVWWRNLVTDPADATATVWQVCYFNGLVFHLHTGTCAISAQRQSRSRSHSAIMDFSRPAPRSARIRAPTDVSGNPVVPYDLDKERQAAFWDEVEAAYQRKAERTR